MSDNTIHTSTKLYGEYRIKVLENNSIIKDTGWCKNTILSSGLISLSSQTIPEVLSFLDIGTSSNLPGAQGYSLSGVISKSINPELINLRRTNLQTYAISSNKVYVANFVSNNTSQETEILREFAIKDKFGTGFSRNVLSTPLEVNFNQSINFEYRLGTEWYSQYDVVVPFKTASGSTFYVSTTSTTFNIPYDRVYYNNNKLVLLRNNEPLPQFGQNYPLAPRYAFNSLTFSTFSPTVVSAIIDNSNRWVTIYENYNNLTAPQAFGIVSDVHTALIVADGKITNCPSKFLATKFKFPLSFYNYSNLQNLNILPVNGDAIYISDYNCYTKNVMSLCYRYTWKESSSALPSGVSNLTNTTIVSGSCENGISADILCGSEVTYDGSSVNVGYRINLGNRTGTTSLNYSTNGVPTRFRIVYNNTEILNSGFRGDVSYSPTLQSLGYTAVAGPSNGSLTFTKSLSNEFANVFITSPIGGANWSFIINCIP